MNSKLAAEQKTFQPLSVIKEKTVSTSAHVSVCSIWRMLSNRTRDRASSDVYCLNHSCVRENHI